MDWIRQIAAIAFVFGLLGGALWWLRRRGMADWRTAGSPARMILVDRLRLTPQHSIHIVRVGKRNFLVAVHTGGCTLLDSLPSEDLDP